MDPLSITVSCLTLIGIASKTSLAVTTFIRGCRDARSDLTSISGELTQLQLVLELLKDDADVTDDRIIPQSLQAQILSIIANCSGVVDKVNKVLQKYATKTGPAKWTTYGKTEVDGLRMSLEAHRGSLSLVLELVSVSLSKAIKEDTAATRSEVRDIKQDTSHIPHIMAELAELRAVVAAGGQNYVLEQYLDSLTSYAETVCLDAVWDSDGSIHVPSGRVSRTSSPKPTPRRRSENLDQQQEARAMPEPEEVRRDPTQGDVKSPTSQSSAPRARIDTPGNSNRDLGVRVSELTRGSTKAGDPSPGDHPPSGENPGTSSNSASSKAAPKVPATSTDARTLSSDDGSNLSLVDTGSSGDSSSWLPANRGPSPEVITSKRIPVPNPRQDRTTLSLPHPQSHGHPPLGEPDFKKKLVVIGDSVGKTSLIMCVCPLPFRAHARLTCSVAAQYLCHTLLSKRELVGFATPPDWYHLTLSI